MCIFINNVFVLQASEALEHKNNKMSMIHTGAHCCSTKPYSFEADSA